MVKKINWKDIDFNSHILVIGNFDGIHIGHIRLIEFAKSFGDVTLLTFTPHPKMVLNGIHSNFLLTLDEEKVKILSDLNVKDIHFLCFTREFANFTSSDFLKNVILKIKPEIIIVGYDFKFGKGRSSDAEGLKSLCREYNIEVKIFPEVLLNNKPVKSSDIRDLVLKGEIEEVRKFILRDYSFEGEVIKGEGIGERIGFPTSNLDVDPKKILPESGVFKVLVNDKYYGMLYIGSKPTFSKEGRFIEVHIFDFNENIYGSKLSIIFLKKLRDEIKFNSLEELKKQLIIDKQKALNDRR
uniref:Riboflavin biosynthesis protein n=1 Tax=candidate division WOR-3 bacterium TaxID=2052148 RepID=A0A7C4U951_UNCW3